MGITPKQFQELQDRTTGKARRSSSNQAPTQSGTGKPSSILGIDPSLRGTGYGIIRFEGKTPHAVAFGTIKVPARAIKSHCLAMIATELRDLLKKHQPEVCVMEGLFFAQNLKTALIMGEARGAALATVAEAGLQIFEIAPRKMKQAIVGFGGAQKEAVARMVQRMLRLEELPDPDAADALGLALAHEQTSSQLGLNPPRPI